MLGDAVAMGGFLKRDLIFVYKSDDLLSGLLQLADPRTGGRGG